MKRLHVFLIILSLVFSTGFLGVGYAALSDTLDLTGSADVQPYLGDVYITSVNPPNSAGVFVKGTSGTVLSARVEAAGTGTFTVTVKNASNKTYVFERVIEGAEIGFEGAYTGTKITAEVTDMPALTELEAGFSRSFTVKITAPAGEVTSNYVVIFNFIEKTWSDILPDEPDPPVDPDPPVEPDPDPPVDPDPDNPDPPVDPDPDDPEVMHGDLRGMVEALLSEADNCLNASNMIYNAVKQTLTHNKRPDEDAPIVHCLVNSVSGGTMSDIAMQANSKLESTMHFIIEADPTDTDRLFIYLYYEDDCTDAARGTEILVYKQVVVRDANDTWVENGSYEGRATVGYYYGGGNNGKDVLTVNAYSWKAGAPASTTAQ